MKINYSDKPFEFLVIEDFLNETQKKEVWNELDFFVDSDLVNKVSSNETDKSAIDSNTMQSLAHRHSIFLQRVYVDARKQSKIYKAIQSNFLVADFDLKYPQSILLKYLPMTNYDSTLVSYYQNGDYYKSHNDSSILTCILYLIKENDFEGGELFFPEYDFKHTPLNNQLIVFPSCINHEVPMLKSFINNDQSYKRISISTFVTINEMR